MDFYEREGIIPNAQKSLVPILERLVDGFGWSVEIVFQKSLDGESDVFYRIKTTSYSSLDKISRILWATVRNYTKIRRQLSAISLN